MSLPVAALAFTIIVSGLWLTRTWGTSPWRWTVWPFVGLALVATVLAYAGKVPPWLIGLTGADKFFHVLLVGGAAFSLNLWLGGRCWPGRIPGAITGMFVLMTVDELAQGFSPVRSLDGLDWAANLAGLGLAWWGGRRASRPSEPAQRR